MGKGKKEKKKIFEKFGVEYEMRGGYLYPKLDIDAFPTMMDVGKYGSMWIRILYDEDQYKYRKMYLSGELYHEAEAINEEAYDYISKVTEKYYRDSDVDKSNTMKVWQLRLQVQDICHEVISSFLLEKIVRDKEIRLEEREGE